jgi:hypothetical protein
VCAFPRARIVSGGPVAEGGLARAGDRTDAAEGGKGKQIRMLRRAEALCGATPPCARWARARARSKNLLARWVGLRATLPPATLATHVLFPREYERVLSYSRVQYAYNQASMYSSVCTHIPCVREGFQFRLDTY